MRPLIQLEAESRIRLRSSWRGSGGRFEQADGRRSAGPKERRQAAVQRRHNRLVMTPRHGAEAAHSTQ